MKFALLASATLLVCASPAMAQDAAVSAAANAGADVIVVLGEGLPDTPAAPAYSTVEIEREQLVTTASGRLEDALANVAGFQQFRRSDSR